MPSRVRVDQPYRTRGPFLQWLAATFLLLWFGGCGGAFAGLAVASSAGADMAPEKSNDDAAATLGAFAGIALVILGQFYRRYPDWFQSSPRYEEPEALDSEPDREPPLREAIFLGTSLAADRNTPSKVFLDHATRNRHVYLIGKTRTGKTSVMLLRISADREHLDR
jgi:hypothetical protein